MGLFNRDISDYPVVLRLKFSRFLFSLFFCFFLSFLSVETAHAESAISLVKSSPTANYTAAGQVISYHYLVTNTGNQTISSIVITDNKTATVNCPVTTLLPGENTTCTSTYTTTQVDVDAGAVTNTATSSGLNPQGTTTTSPTSSYTVNAVLTPAITVVKSSTTTTYGTPGQRITYRYLVTNTGNNTLSTVGVTDNKITGSILCGASTLAPAAQTTCMAVYVTTQTDVDNGSLTNTATASGKDRQGTVVTATSNLTIPAVQTPSIRLTTSTTTPSFSAAGQTIDLTYSVTNTGNQTLNTVSINPSAGVTCLATTLDPNASTTCTGSYTTTQADVNAGFVTLTATSNGTNNSLVTVTSTPSGIMVYALQAPAISLTKSSPTVNFNAPGQTVNYNYTVINTGNITLTSVAVADNKATTTCAANTLEPGVSTTCTATYTTTQADVDAGGVTNRATASGQNPDLRTFTSTTQTVTVPAVQTPSMTIAKSSSTASFNGTNQFINYSYTVTNTGNTTLTGIQITDDKIATNLITCTPSSVGPGLQTTCTGRYMTTLTDVNAGGVTNTATASSGSTTSSPVSVTVPAIQESALNIVKSTPTTLITAPGQIIVYTYQVKNTGNDTISSISITDPTISIPITCLRTSLDPTTSTTCSATYITTQADVDAGGVTNNATANGINPLGTPVASTSDTVFVPATRTQSLLLTKSANPTSFSSAGTLITYNYVVNNTGTVTLSAVNVTDPHAGLSAISCPVSTLAPGVSTTCIATYTTTAADVARGSISNTGTVNATSPIGVVQSSSSVTIPGPQNPSISIQKSANVGSFSAAGTVITYYYSITNTGNVALNTLNVTDPHSGLSAVSCPVTTLAPGASTTCTATYTTTAADVTNGSINNTGTVSANSPSGPVTGMSSLTIPWASGANLESISLTKSASISGYSASGTGITYSYLVTNTGQIGFTFTLTDPHSNLSAINCPTTTLASGASTTCTATYTTTQADVDAGSINNTANAAVGTTQAISSLSIPGTQTPSISLVKTSTTPSYNGPSQIVSYDYLVTNTGNQTVNSIAISDNKITPANLVCPTTTLAPNAQTTCTGIYETTQADVDAGSIANTATATARSPQGTSVNANSSANVSAALTSTLSVTKSTSTTSYNAPGQTLSYKYVVKNTGNNTINSITVTDTKIASVSCAATSLAPNVSTICTGSYTTILADVNAGQVLNTTTASGTDSQSATVTSPPSSVTVHAVITPVLSIVKSTTSLPFDAPGATLNYTYAVTNTGNVTINSLAISDSKIPTIDIHCLATTLDPSASTTCTGSYTTTQADVDAGAAVNTATASGTTDLLSTVVSNTSSASVTAIQSPAITLTKSTSTASFSSPNQLINYTYTVKNTGNDTLNSISISDDRVATANISCSATTLAPGATTTCSSVYITTQADLDAAKVTNIASASAKNFQGTSVTSPTSSVTVNATLNASITVAKSTTATGFTAAGQSIPYTYLVKNTGNNTLTGIFITDNKIPTVDISCLVTTLAPNMSTTCSGTYTTTLADVDAGGLTNTATSSGQYIQGTVMTVTSAPSSTTLIAQQTPSISISKLSLTPNYNAPGQHINYLYVVKNTGNDTLHAIAVTDNKIATVTCLATTLAPNISTTCTGTYITTQADVDAGSVTNKATSSGTNTHSTTVTSPQASATVNAVLNPAISLVKATTTTSYSAPGVSIPYTYTVTNAGNDTLHAIAVTDNKIATVSCPATTLAPGVSTICTGSYTTTQADVDAGSVENIATASGLNLQNTMVTSPQSSVTVLAALHPSLSLAKSASASTFTMAGQNIGYSYLVTNTGNDTINSISISDDTIPTADITCPITTLAPGASTTCTSTYTITQANVDAGSLTNKATASGNNHQGTTVTSPIATLTLTGTITSGITLVKSTTTASFDAPDQNISYEYLVTNTGNDTLNQIFIIDNKVLSSHITCPVNRLAPGVSTTCTSTYKTTQADVDAGSVTNIASASARSSQGAPVNSTDSSVTVNAVLTPSISLEKTTTTINYSDPGQSINYQYVVTNTGNNTINTLSIADDKVPTPDIHCPVTTLAPNASTICTGTYITTSADVTAGSVTNTATATALDSQGTVLTTPPASLTVIYVLPGGSISLVKTASVSSFVLPGTLVTYTYLVTDTGVTPIHSLKLTDSKLGEISCPSTTLEPGASMTCTATYSTTTGDALEGNITNTATVTGIVISGTPVSAQSAVTIVLDEELIRKKTLSAIRNFLNGRAQLILSDEPDRRRNINRLSGRTGACSGAPNGSLSPSGNGDGATMNASASLSEMCAPPSPFDAWTEVHASYYNQNRLEIAQHGEFGVAYLGLDYLIHPSILVGVLTEADLINQSGFGQDSARAHGNGWMAGPYLSAQLMKDLYLHTRAAFGGSRNTIDPLGFYDDHFNTSRSLYQAELVGDWYNKHVRISPTLGVTYYSDLQKSYINFLGVSIPGQRVNLGQVNVGPEFAYMLHTESNKEVTFRLALQGLYNFNNKNNNALIDNEYLVPVSDFSGRVKLGVEVKLPSGVSLTPMLLCDGIGASAYQSIQAQLQISVPLS